MPSPFPGMDPFLEASGLWEGFHNHLVEDFYRALAQQLPRGYSIDTATRSYVVLMEPEGKSESLAKPDVTTTDATTRKKPRRKKGSVAVAEPDEDGDSVPMRAFIAETFEESFVEIYAEREEWILVTCIEVLSPSNKRPGSEGWNEYLRKRQAMLLGRANFLELDLLRGGPKMPMLDAWPKSPYTLLLCRALDAPHCRVWRGHWERRLPAIPVPLLPTDPDLRLDLQPMMDHIYSLGRYEDRIDYSRPLTPPLSQAEAASVKKLLEGRKLP